MFENFPVCKLFGSFDSRREESFECHGATGFFEIDMNVPTVCPLAHYCLSTCSVDTFERRHEMPFPFFGEGLEPGVYSLPTSEGIKFLKKDLRFLFFCLH